MRLTEIREREEMHMRNFLYGLRDKMVRFMEGRNGMDELARAESVLVWIVLILSLFLTRIPVAAIVCNILFWVLVIHMYFRVFSKNLNKRYAENQRYTNARYRMIVAKNRRKKERAQSGAYKFFSCPNCKQRVRVPKGRGKICITCPKCRTEFTKRS